MPETQNPNQPQLSPDELAALRLDIAGATPQSGQQSVQTPGRLVAPISISGTEGEPSSPEIAGTEMPVLKNKTPGSQDMVDKSRPLVMEGVEPQEQFNKPSIGSKFTQGLARIFTGPEAGNNLNRAFAGVQPLRAGVSAFEPGPSYETRLNDESGRALNAAKSQALLAKPTSGNTPEEQWMKYMGTQTNPDTGKPYTAQDCCLFLNK